MNRKCGAIAFVFLLTCSFALADQATESAQQKLKEQGFYYGEINGNKDADTVAAIRRYQIRNGLQITGELNVETQQSLGLASKPATTPKPRPAQTPGPTPPGFLDATPAPKMTPGPQPPPPQNEPETSGQVEPNADAQTPRFDAQTPFGHTPYEAAPPQIQQDIVMQAQTRLMRQGFYRDEVDGRWGPPLTLALRNYQIRLGLQPTGRLDVETLAALDLLPEQRLTRHPRLHRPAFPPWARRGPGGERIYIPR